MKKPTHGPYGPLSPAKIAAPLVWPFGRLYPEDHAYLLKRQREKERRASKRAGRRTTTTTTTDGD